MSLGTSNPFVASYAILRKKNKIAFILRENTSWMSGFYGLPSGKVEIKESATQAAIREAKEEVGVDILPEDLTFLLSVQRFEKGNEYGEWVDFYFEATRWSGELINAEPHRHSKIEWLDQDNLPTNVIPAVRFALGEIAKGSVFAEYSD